MYYQPATQKFLATHSAVRVALNVSFPDNITDAQLAAFGVYPITPVRPVYDPMTQNATEVDPVQDEKTGLWMQQWVITSATAEEIVERQNDAKNKNKDKAVGLLQSTDWVELPSVSDPSVNPHLVNKTDFIAYRASLRAIAIAPPVVVTQWPATPVERWS